MKRYVKKGIIDVERLTHLWSTNILEKYKPEFFTAEESRFYKFLQKWELEFFIKDEVLHVGLIVEHDKQKEWVEKKYLHELEYYYREITGLKDLILCIEFNQREHRDDNYPFGEEYRSLEPASKDFKGDLLKKIGVMKAYKTEVKRHLCGFLIDHERFWHVVGVGVIYCPVLFSRHNCTLCNEELVYICYRHSVVTEDKHYIDLFGTIELCPNCLKQYDFYLENQILGGAPFVRGEEPVKQLKIDFKE